jgi:hypothetical protein
VHDEKIINPQFHFYSWFKPLRRGGLSQNISGNRDKPHIPFLWYYDKIKPTIQPLTGLFFFTLLFATNIPPLMGYTLGTTPGFYLHEIFISPLLILSK